MKTVNLYFEKKVIVPAKVQIDETEVFIYAGGHAPVRIFYQTAREPDEMIRQAISLFEQENGLTLKKDSADTETSG